VATNVYMEALSPPWRRARGGSGSSGTGPREDGETLAEVETDKAVMDLVARRMGATPGRRRRGPTVAVGSVVAVIAAPGKQSAQHQASSPIAGTRANPGSGERERRQPRERGAGSGTLRRGAGRRTRVKASPLAKRIAQEAGSTSSW